MKTILILTFIVCYSSIALSQEFNQKVLSKDITPECDAKKGDERGPFGITYKEGSIKHDFLIMTGVYYDTCKDLEGRINKLKRHHSHLILRGSGKNIFAPKNYVWRWHSIQTDTDKECISYFVDDCETNN